MGGRRFIRRIAALLRFNKAENELSREIASHLQLLEDQFVARGLSRDEARYAAKRAFGGVEQTKELQRDARSFRWLAGWPIDLKLGVRMLARSPGLTIVGVIALAVAIGAGAAYLEFTSDLLKPALNVPDADRIVGVTAWNPREARDETRKLTVLDTWRRNSTTLEDLGGTWPVSRHLTTPDGLTDPVRASEMSATGFRLMSAVPLFGRTLSNADEEPGAPPVAVIGEDVWINRFGKRADVIGQPARLGSIDYTVVGVMPGGFGFPERENLWIPLKDRTRVFHVFGRLKDGASLTAAQAELAGMAEAAMPGLQGRAEIHVEPYLDSVSEEDRRGGEVLIIRAINLVFVVLLSICGANVATLVFARTAMREAEITVRTALGASRARICSQLFAEALVLSIAAAAAGLLAARVVGQWVKGLWTEGIGGTPFWWNDSLGLPTIAYAGALAVFAALIVGVIPALKATGPQLQSRVREAASGTSTMKFGGVWTAVIVAQAALTVVFVSAAFSLGWAALKSKAGINVGYSRDHLLVAGIGRDTDAPSLDDVLAAIRREPGVADVSLTTALPGTVFEQFGYELQAADLQRNADARKQTDTLWSQGAQVTERFFETAGFSLKSGRTFTTADIRSGAAVAVVDETFVRLVLGGQNAIGVRLRQSAGNNSPAGPWLEIVGVVSPALISDRLGTEDAAVYRVGGPDQFMRLLVRTQGAASLLMQRVYAAARSADPNITLISLRTAAQVVYDDALPDRTFFRVFTVISAIALLLATAGIYSLMSFTLARRTREVGVRVALGAMQTDILFGVFGRVFRQIGIGVAIGSLPGFAIIESLAVSEGYMKMYSAFVAMAGVAGFVVLVALVSCTVPLRRALAIHPTDALRAQ